MQLKKPYERLIVRLTRRCQLHCPECAVRAVSCSGEQDTTEAQFLNAVRRFCGLGLTFKTAILTGGEPTLCPYLPRAARWLRLYGVTRYVRAISNALQRGVTVEDYGDIDELHVSDYGGLNFYNYQRLRAARGGVKIRRTHVCHVPTDVREAANPLPAICPCTGCFLWRDKVYPCGHAALQDVNGCSVNADFVTHLNSLDPLRQDICRTCFSNRRNRADRLPPFTVVAFILESSHEIVLQLPWRLNFLRKPYRKWLARER